MDAIAVGLLLSISVSVTAQLQKIIELHETHLKATERIERHLERYELHKAMFSQPTSLSSPLPSSSTPSTPSTPSVTNTQKRVFSTFTRHARRLLL